MASIPDCTVELAADSACDLGEGPIYDPRTDTLYFVDITAGTIHAHVTTNGSVAPEPLTLDEPIGAVALTTDPDLLLAATRRHILLVRVRGGHRGVVKTLAEVPEADGAGPELRFNDIKATPGGALLAGRMHSAWRSGHRGKLYALDPGAATPLREVLPGPGLPNGMAWSADGKICYFVDSAEESITAYPTDALGVPLPGGEGGRVVSSRPTGHKHVPDGLAIDAAGCLWVALGDSGAVTRVDAATGEELGRVELPVKRPTSCGFGGPELEWLYVTTRVEAGEGASPHHGGLFRVRIPGVRGAAPEPQYKL